MSQSKTAVRTKTGIMASYGSGKFLAEFKNVRSWSQKSMTAREHSLISLVALPMPVSTLI